MEGSPEHSRKTAFIPVQSSQEGNWSGEDYYGCFVWLYCSQTLSATSSRQRHLEIFAPHEEMWRPQTTHWPLSHLKTS